MEIQNKVAVIIGGASGVGSGVCRGLSSRGAKIVVADIDAAGAERVKDELVTSGCEAIAVKVDATDTSSLKSLASDAIDHFGSVSILVNTVGVILEKQLEDVSDTEWQWIWDLNFMTQVKAVRAFLPLLRKNSKSHVVLTASGAGFIAPTLPSLGAYAATKHALVGYAKVLRYELSSEEIGVSVLCPSGVEGNLASTSAKSYKETVANTRADLGGGQPAGRKLVSSSEMGPLVVDAISNNKFLVSNDKDGLLEIIKEQDNLL